MTIKNLRWIASGAVATAVAVVGGVKYLKSKKGKAKIEAAKAKLKAARKSK